MKKIIATLALAAGSLIGITAVQSTPVEAANYCTATISLNTATAGCTSNSTAFLYRARATCQSIWGTSYKYGPWVSPKDPVVSKATCTIGSVIRAASVNFYTV